MKFKRTSVIKASVCLLVMILGMEQVYAQLVPGTGTKVGGEDFEDEKWTFYPQLPKSSFNLDKQRREPLGTSSNRIIYESAKRGAPDYLKRVATPAGGLSGSKGALLIQTLNSGIPGRVGGKSQQDDLLMRGMAMSVGWSPSCVVRVYMPPFEEWDDSTDTSFGIRAACNTTKTERKKTLFFSRTKRVNEKYWPGFFIQFNSKTDGKNKEDSAYFIIRGDTYGRDFRGPDIKQTGWWTLGMSFTPDGQVHYYAHPGVADLTAKDHIVSQFPYGYKCEQFHTMFFNIISRNDGKSWSTKWIIDDPSLYHNGYGNRSASRGVRRN